jgi:hypothetical protein
LHFHLCAFDTTPMTVKQVRSARGAAPFHPFNVRMADGRSFHVPHPDVLSMSPPGRPVIIYHENDELSILDLLLMTGIEMVQSSAAPA